MIVLSLTGWIPALLQTEDYALAATRASSPERTERELHREVELRRSRSSRTSCSAGGTVGASRCCAWISRSRPMAARRRSCSPGSSTARRIATTSADIDLPCAAARARR